MTSNRGALDREALRIAPEVARRLGFCVDLYSDPRTRRPFYVGKGRGWKLLSHWMDRTQSRKGAKLRELARKGLTSRREVLAHGLPSEEAALRIEAAVIDLFGLAELTNRFRGRGAVRLGRVALDELNALYAAKPVKIRHACLLIRVPRGSQSPVSYVRC